MAKLPWYLKFEKWEGDSMVFKVNKWWRLFMMAKIILTFWKYINIKIKWRL